MKYKNKKLIALNLILAGVLTGCSAPNVDVSKSFWENKNQQVDIARSPAAQNQAQFYPVGAQGVLDIVINKSVNGSMNKMLTEYNGHQVILNARSIFLTELKKNHIKARIVDVVDASKLSRSHEAAAQYSTRDYRALSQKYGSDKLLTITIDQLAETRNYYSFIPTDAPHAICVITGRLINVKDNHILWRHTVAVVTDIQKPRHNQQNFYAAINQAAQNATQNLANNFVENAKK